jgi:hypothetical protein
VKRMGSERKSLIFKSKLKRFLFLMTIRVVSKSISKKGKKVKVKGDYVLIVAQLVLVTHQDL